MLLGGPGAIAAAAGIACSPLPPRGCSCLRSHRGHLDSSNHTSMSWATPRWEDSLTVFPGLSSSQTQGGHFHTHSNNNIPTSLSCSASLMMQSLQENFPPKICDPLMETTKATTRGQSKSCPTKTLRHWPGANARSRAAHPVDAPLTLHGQGVSQDMGGFCV